MKTKLIILLVVVLALVGCGKPEPVVVDKPSNNIEADTIAEPDYAKVEFVMEVPDCVVDIAAHHIKYIELDNFKENEEYPIGKFSFGEVIKMMPQTIEIDYDNLDVFRMYVKPSDFDSKGQPFFAVMYDFESLLNNQIVPVYEPFILPVDELKAGVHYKFTVVAEGVMRLMQVYDVVEWKD